MANLTVTQSETLKVGQRGEFHSRSDKFTALVYQLGVKMWVEKRKRKIDESEKALQQLIGSIGGYALAYGVTWEGKDYEVGDMPRDLGPFVRGMCLVKGIPFHKA